MAANLIKKMFATHFEGNKGHFEAKTVLALYLSQCSMFVKVMMPGPFFMMPCPTPLAGKGISPCLLNSNCVREPGKQASPFPLGRWLQGKI